jgi:hypothetical protein
MPSLPYGAPLTPMEKKGKTMNEIVFYVKA